jgi:DNA polymerase III subunit gamma/tau
MPSKRPEVSEVAAGTLEELLTQKAVIGPILSPSHSDWHEIVAGLQLSGLARTLAQHCELRSVGETECLLRLSPTHGHLQMKPAPDKLQQALRDYFGRPLLLRFELAQQDKDSPAVTASREKQQRQESAVASIEQDMFVRDVIESFDASVIESSIKPIA